MSPTQRNHDSNINELIIHIWANSTQFIVIKYRRQQTTTSPHFGVKADVNNNNNNNTNNNNNIFYIIDNEDTEG